MAEEHGFIGEEHDFLVRQGQTFLIELTVTKEDRSPFDLTGYTVHAQLRRRPRDANVVKTFAALVANATGGVVTLALTAAETAELQCGDTLYDASSVYVYDVELVKGAEVYPAAWGKLRVHREVTRA